jgi:iron complex outermembrane receptor protein
MATSNPKTSLSSFLIKKISVSALALSAAATAHAQDTNAEEDTETRRLEQVTVTARRVEENLQSTPVTVSAFTERALEVRGITDTVELAQFTPNVTFDSTSTFSGASNTFQGFIRGIGQSDFAVNTDPGVGVYVDDVYIARTVGSIFGLADIQQVEVLKGPQGTLFGRNTIGGAVNITTARPDFDEFSFKASAEIGRFDRLAFDGAVNIPISNTLAATFAFQSQDQDGFQDFVTFDPTGVVTPDNPLGIPTGPSAQAPFSVLTPIDQINVADTNNGGDRGALDNQAIRGKLLWAPTDRFQSTLSADFSRTRDAAPAGTLVSLGSADDATFTDPATGLPQGLTPEGVLVTSLTGLFNACLGGPPAGAIPPCALIGGLEGVNNDGDPTNDVGFFSNDLIPDDIDQTFATGANFSNIDSWGISSVNEFDILSNLTLKSITAYREVNGTFGRDIDNSPFSLDQTSFALDQDQFSQEIQLNGQFFDGRLDFTVGGFAFLEDALQIDQVPLAGGILNIFGPNFQETRALSLFGEANFDVTDKLTVLFGVRFTDEQKELQLDQQNTTPFFAGAFAAPTPSGFIEDADGDTPFPRLNPDGSPNIFFLGPEELQVANFDDVSFRAGVNYQLTEDVFTYFTFSQGFKSGGFTTRLVAPFNPDFEDPTPTPAGEALPGIVFDPETSDNFEIGFKGDLLNDTLRLNAAAFWNNYDDIQIVLQAGISPLNANAGDARIRGIELEAEWYPVDNLSLIGSFGYIDAEYRSISELVAPQVTIDDDLQNTPEFTFALAGNYIYEIPGNRGDLSFNANYSWRSETANDAQNTPELIQDSVGQLGGQIKYEPENANWALSVIGRNITNERIIGAGFNSGGLSFVEASFNRPGEWRVRLDYAF